MDISTKFIIFARLSECVSHGRVKSWVPDTTYVQAATACTIRDIPCLYSMFSILVVLLFRLLELRACVHVTCALRLLF